MWMLMCQSDWVVNPEVDGWKRHRQQFLLKSIRPLTVKQELGIAAVLKKVAIGKGLGLSRQRVKKRQFCVSEMSLYFHFQTQPHHATSLTTRDLQKTR